jgi:hypothetical protein
MALTVSSVVAAYDSHYLDEGQNQKRVLQLLTQGRDLPKYCTPMVTNETIFRLANSTLGEIVQGFQKSFTAKGGLAIIPNEIRLFHLKVDDEFQPDDLQGTWLAFWANLSEPERKNWPFVKWVVENHYKGKIDADMEKLAYYKGVYEIPATGVAQTTAKSFTGLQKQIQDGVDAGTVNSVELDALDATTIFDQVEEFTDGISQEYQGVEMNVFMSPYWYKKYKQDGRAQGFYQRMNSGQIDDNIDFTPLNVKPLVSMTGTNDIFCTPKPNLIWLYSADKKSFHLEESKRSVAVLADWWEGLGFGINQAVWTNIQPTGSGSN